MKRLLNRGDIMIRFTRSWKVGESNLWWWNWGYTGHLWAEGGNIIGTSWRGTSLGAGHVLFLNLNGGYKNVYSKIHLLPCVLFWFVILQWKHKKAWQSHQLFCISGYCVQSMLAAQLSIQHASTGCPSCDESFDRGCQALSHVVFKRPHKLRCFKTFAVCI